MDYVRYLTERGLEFRNLAITTGDPVACQGLHQLADLCAAKATFLVGRERPPALAALAIAKLRAEN